MPNAFNFNASPFDCLTQDQQRLVRDNLDVAYFRPGEVLLEVGAAPTHLFVLIKGHVTQFDGDEVIAAYGPDDSFDGRALVAGKSSSRFVAAEEVVTYELARQTVKDLIAANADFGALLFSDLGQKLSALGQRQHQNELVALNTARVEQAFLRPVQIVDADTDIVSVVRVFHEKKTSNVLVRDSSTDPPRLGIFTATALHKAVLRGTPLDQMPVGSLANYQLITVQAQDQVGDALALLLRHAIHRVVVMDRGEVRGVLESLDVFAFLSNHSHLIGMQIDAAETLDELADAAGRITPMIGRMVRSGTRVPLVATMVRDLNARLFARTWALIAPPDLVAASCLFVMGSEGRGEQLLKTDQDNGLVWRDDYTPPDDLQAICDRFSAALASFGYPECPGRIMVNNPQWRMSAGDFARTVRRWLLMPEADSLMNLAIFLDAHAVAGDARLLEGVREGLMALATDNDATLARFAAAIDAFGSSDGWWNRVLELAGADAERLMNLKKEGIFPLVHGVRSLALAHRLREQSTVERIQALQAAGELSAATARELGEALRVFMGVRLEAGLTELDRGQPVSGVVDINALSTAERDLLKDALGVVRRFKVQLRHRFKLSAV